MVHKPAVGQHKRPQVHSLIIDSCKPTILEQSVTGVQDGPLEQDVADTLWPLFRRERVREQVSTLVPKRRCCKGLAAYLRSM